MVKVSQRDSLQVCSRVAGFKCVFNELRETAKQQE